MPDPVFDPTLPANNSPISAAELRDQFNALETRIAALEGQITNCAIMPSLSEFTVGFHNPPTLQDVQNIGSYLHDLAWELQGGTL